MNIKNRLEKLERAAPREDGGVRMIWNTAVRRDGSGLRIERPVRAVIVRQPAAANATVMRHEAEGQAAFLNRVMEAVRRVHGREDLTFEEELRWRSSGQADISE